MKLKEINKGYLLIIGTYSSNEYKTKVINCDTIEDVLFLVDLASCFKETRGSDKGFGDSFASVNEVIEKYIQVKSKHTNISDSLKEKWQIDNKIQNQYVIDCISQLIGVSERYWPSFEWYEVFEVPNDLKNVSTDIWKQLKTD